LPDDSEPIRYTLTFPSPESHYLEVEASVPTGGAPHVELTMPVWTPGSYKIREHSRHVEGLRAESFGGNRLEAIKTRKNRWRLQTFGAGRVHLLYRVYGRELSVRTNFIDAGFALLNGAATFLTLADGVERPHEVDVVLPTGWREVVTALAPSVGGGPHRFVAPDHDTLVDSPIYLGCPALYRFEVSGVPHLLANEGEDGVWNGPRSAADLERLVDAAQAFWGGLPYARFAFINLITGTRGGLEHAESTVLMASRWAARTREGYLEWLALVAHELFHAWNIKRLRPVELGPFDYDRESYTRSLWFVEGVTSYYDDLLVHRAGLSSREEYLARLSKTIRALQTTPGRRAQSLEEASYDAWIKLYMPDENSSSSAISYYVKGAVVAWLLDARIRRASGGKRSLDDLMRAAYQRFSGERGFEAPELEELIDEVAGAAQKAFLQAALRSTRELEYGDALELLGLRFRRAGDERADRGEVAPAESRGQRQRPPEKPGWLGAATRVDNGRLLVTEVRRETPAHDAGVDVDDEILAIDQHRVPPEGLAERLRAYRPGEKISLLVARRELLTRLDVTLGEEPDERWHLEPDPEATAQQRATLDAWLGRSDGPPSEA
jgi:predicted metalloprotease with PDZ domain